MNILLSIMIIRFVVFNLNFLLSIIMRKIKSVNRITNEALNRIVEEFHIIKLKKKYNKFTVISDNTKHIN